MHKRTAHRWRLSATIMVGIAFALGSFWLVQLMHNDEADLANDARKNEPDYIVEKFSFVRMTPAGAPRYIITGAKLTHRPIDDTADIEQPIVKSVAPDRAPMTVHANTARVRNADNQIDLVGGVEVDQPATAQSQHLRIRTEAMTILPDEDVMRSDLAVELVSGAATMSGVGIEANNATQQLHLNAQSKIVYPPHAARTGRQP